MYIDMTTTQYQMHRGLQHEFWNVSKWACDDELQPMLITVPSSQLITQRNLLIIKIFQEHQQNCRRFPVFPWVSGVVDTMSDRVIKISAIHTT